MTNSPQLKMILLLYSEFSPKCKELRSLLNEDHVKHFTPICIDDPKTRKIITNSSSIKVYSVPCILQIFEDGTVAKYEDSQLFKWVAQTFLQQPKPVSKSLPTTPLSSLPREEEPLEKEDTTTMDRYIRSSNLNSDIVEGEGHQNLAASSLAGMGNKTKIIEDIETTQEEVLSLDTDPSGMNSVKRQDQIEVAGTRPDEQIEVIRDDRTNTMSRAENKKSKAIKELASEMAQIRDNSEKTTNKDKRKTKN